MTRSRERFISWRRFEEITGRQRPPGAVDRQDQNDLHQIELETALRKPRVYYRKEPRAAVPSGPQPGPIADNDNEPPNDRVPFVEEYKAGRFDERHWQAAGWYLKTEEAAEAKNGGSRRSAESGVHHPHINRDPAALWGQEIAADYSLKIEKVMRAMGPLLGIVDAALLHAAEMQDLAPKAIPIPKARKAEAGRIRLRAGLEILARLAECERDNAILTRVEIDEIIAAAADSCWALAGPGRGGKREGAGRKPIADNDNMPTVKEAAA